MCCKNTQSLSLLYRLYINIKEKEKKTEKNNYYLIFPNKNGKFLLFILN